MIAGTLLLFGILLLIIGGFFWFPELGTMFFSIQNSSENDSFMKKQYRPFAAKLLLIGILFVLIGSYLIYQG